MNSGVFTPMLVEVGLVTWRGILNGTNTDNPIPHLPIPAVYTDVAVVYGALSLIGGRFERVAVLVGWGYVVATALAMFAKAGTVNNTVSTTPTTEVGVGQ